MASKTYPYYLKNIPIMEYAGIFHPALKNIPIYAVSMVEHEDTKFRSGPPWAFKLDYDMCPKIYCQSHVLLCATIGMILMHFLNHMNMSQIN